MVRSYRLTKRILLLLALIGGFGRVGGLGASSLDAARSFREGYVAATGRDWTTAVEQFTKSIGDNPKDAEVYFHRAVAYQMIGRPAEAIADYEKAIQLRPDYYLAIEYLATLYRHHGRNRKAIELYTRALPLVPEPKWRSILQTWISEAAKKPDTTGNSAKP